MSCESCEYFYCCESIVKNKYKDCEDCSSFEESHDGIGFLNFRGD